MNHPTGNHLRRGRPNPTNGRSYGQNLRDLLEQSVAQDPHATSQARSGLQPNQRQLHGDD